MKRDKGQPEITDQGRAFIEKARELGCDEDPRAFERVFEQIVPPKRRPGDVPAGKASRKPRRGSR
jgi:hypothetical protein